MCYIFRNGKICSLTDKYRNLDVTQKMGKISLQIRLFSMIPKIYAEKYLSKQKNKF